MRITTPLVIGCLLSATPVRAELVTVCEKPSGQTVALEQKALVWEPDGLSRGSISIHRSADGLYDIGIKDAVASFAARVDGASVLADTAPGSGLMLVARYPLGTVETYALTLDGQGTGTLIMASMKNRIVGAAKGSLFTAECRRP